MDIWLTSDKAVPWQGIMEWKLITLSGEVLDSGRQEAALQPQESKQIFSRTFDLKPDQKRSVVFAAELKQDGERISSALATFTPNKFLELVDPQLKVDVKQEGSQVAYTVTGKSLARFVELKLSGADVVFSDNYFDLPVGSAVQVRSPIPAGWNIDQVRKALQVTSLYQSF
jgi:beta-mannosidase